MPLERQAAFGFARGDRTASPSATASAANGKPPPFRSPGVRQPQPSSSRRAGGVLVPVPPDGGAVRAQGTALRATSGEQPGSGAAGGARTPARAAAGG